MNINLFIFSFISYVICTLPFFNSLLFHIFMKDIYRYDLHMHMRARPRVCVCVCARARARDCVSI